ncbi:MAG: hypothetical protein AB7E13_11535 [Arcobacteraceae bacterium]
MKTIIVLKNLISETEAKVKLFKRQLSEHESGINRLSRVIKASTETNLLEGTQKLETYSQMLKDAISYIPKDDEYVQELENAVKKQQAYNIKQLRLKKIDYILIPSDKKLESMKIFDEFDLQDNITEDNAFEIFISINGVEDEKVEEYKGLFKEINKDFNGMLKSINKNEDIYDLGILNYKIVLFIVNFHILTNSIKELLTPKVEESSDNQEKPKTNFKGYPKYEDWWIDELCKNPEAYLALYKWKSIIGSLCVTSTNKLKWEKIFKQWIFIKTLLNTKKERAYPYQYAFDMLLKKYCDLEEELEDENIEALENIIHTVILKEDMTSITKGHHLVTAYLKYKKDKLQ